MSWTGLFRATISSSHPLHDPASTSRMARDRPRTFWIVSRAFFPRLSTSVSALISPVINFAQPAVRAVGIQCVFRGKNQVTAVRRRQFKFLGDAHRLLGRCFGAQAAEDTETVIDGDFPGITFVG